MWDFSLFIKKQLLKRVTDHLGNLEDLRTQIHQGNSALMRSIAQMLDEEYDSILASLKNQLPNNIPLEIFMETRFCERVKQNVLEAIYSEALCPALVILPKIRSFSQVTVPDLPIHLILVEYLPNVAHEVYPLMLDSYLYDLEHWGRTKRLVVCAHTSWINENCEIERGIFYLENYENPMEFDLETARAVSSAQFLCLSPNVHQEWCDHFEKHHIPLVNPYASAKLADDKFACYQVWNQAGINTPEAVLLCADQRNETSLEKSLEVLQRHHQDLEWVVLQPNRGTEGRGTKAFPVLQEEKIPTEMLQHAQTIAAKDDVLVRKGVGNVKIVDETQNETVYFDIRIHVINGKAESGFLMLSKAGNYVSSPGIGGHVVEWTRGKEWTVQTPEHLIPFQVNDEVWNLIENTAEKAASAFNETRMLGIDVRLEWKNGQWTAWVLDCNPRPAGLCHSRFSSDGEPGVTQRLWPWLNEQCEA